METQLQIIVKESGLEKTKADFILKKFQDYFKIAAEWEEKVKTIVVTEESQTVEMQFARTGRLFLREKRTDIEKARKTLKEQIVREGKAIDGIANVLKALIIPIEQYLDRQEKFVEYKKAAEETQHRLEVEKRMEEERIAKERAEAEEQERIRKENEQLKAEAIERERLAEIERKKQAEEITKIKAEKEKAEAKQKEEETKAEEERKKAEEIATKVKLELEAKTEAVLKERQEKERMEEKLKNLVKCPWCGKEFSLDKGGNDNESGT